MPYARQSIDKDDEQAVLDALRSDFLTTGSRVVNFETALARRVNTQHAVAVCNGTAALHAAYFATGLGPGNEVIVPTMTFAATANAAVYVGARPVFVDCDPATLLVDVEKVKEAITTRTKAVVGVDFAGQPADWQALREIAADHRIKTVCDGAHALGAIDADGQRTGEAADITAFSFHPAKHITTGEGGMVTTDDAGAASRARMFRNHGIALDYRERARRGQMTYDIDRIGYNLRLSDIQAALGTSQLKHLEPWIVRRNKLAGMYKDGLRGHDLQPLHERAGVRHAYHLFVVRAEDRNRRLSVLRNAGIGAAIHYKPVHLHSYYRSAFPSSCPNAEEAFRHILSLPLFPAMMDSDVDRVLGAT